MRYLWLRRLATDFFRQNNEQNQKYDIAHTIALIARVLASATKPILVVLTTTTIQSEIVLLPYSFSSVFFCINTIVHFRNLRNRPNRTKPNQTKSNQTRTIAFSSSHFHHGISVEKSRSTFSAFRPVRSLQLSVAACRSDIDSHLVSIVPLRRRKRQAQV